MPRSTKRIAPRSAKRDAAYAGPDGRRALVVAMLAEFPVCQIQAVCSGARSVDLHEVKSRARGGSILDRANILTTCRLCHTYVTEHPAEAEENGWSKASWA